MNRRLDRTLYINALKMSGPMAESNVTLRKSDPRDGDQARKEKKAGSHVRAVTTIQIGERATSSTHALPTTVVNRHGIGTAAMAAVTATTC